MDTFLHHTYDHIDSDNDTPGDKLAYIKNLLELEKKRSETYAAIFRTLSDLSLNLSDMLAFTARQISEITNDLSLIYLFPIEGKRIGTIVSYHSDELIRNVFENLHDSEVFDLNKGILDQVIRTGLPVIHPLIGNDSEKSELLPLAYEIFLKKYSFTYLIAIPININHNVNGILILINNRAENSFTLDDQAFLQNIAGILAVAITNARLYNETIKESEEQRHSREKIELLLQEKENLLREVRHRVKNNLQVVSSLLNIQSEYVRDEEAHRLFINSLNRIKAMAMIHENIYKSINSIGIDIDKYLKDLIVYLFRFYNINAGLIKLSIDCREISLNLETAITCGLLINEIISNSFKHAFPDGRSGNVHFSVTESGKQIIMLVSDNGIGLTGSSNLENPDTFGLLLISTLVDQLNGVLELDRENGTKFTIKFPGNSD